MNATAPPAIPQSKPRRSLFVTLLAWVIIVISGLLIPISVISLLMIMVGSHGTSTTDPVGFLIVVVLPAASLVGGIGLLRRRAWGRYYVMGLLGLLIAHNGWQLISPRQETTTYTSSDGVKTTVVTSYGYTYHRLPIVVICSLLLAGLNVRPVREEFAAMRTWNPPANAVRADEPAKAPAPSAAGRDWRVGHQGRDRMYYEQWLDGAWQRLDIDGELLTGSAHHAIYFDSPQRWQTYPEWARDRREEIVARIKSEFRPPDYEYHEGAEGRSATLPHTAAARQRPTARANFPRATLKQQAALLLTIVILLGITGYMGWIVAGGVSSGATKFPAKRPSQQRQILRQDEPATFWFSIGIYSAIGLGTGGAALWCIRQACRQEN